MRKILFRGKRWNPIPSKDKKDWVCGGVLQTEDNMSIIFTDVVNGTNAVHTDTICQYTGKDDCDGHHVFVGDIIETETALWVVKFDQGAFLVSCLSYRCLEYLYSLAGPYRIIGNVFDNPDILKKYLEV